MTIELSLSDGIITIFRSASKLSNALPGGNTWHFQDQ